MGNKPIGASDVANSGLTVFRSPKRVRGVIGGETIVDSREALLLRGDKIKPIYLFPVKAIASQVLKQSGSVGKHQSGLDVAYWSFASESRSAPTAGWSPLASQVFERVPLSEYIGLEWNSVDSWYEEDEEIFGHPRDSNVRVDALSSSSHVLVVVKSEVVAETRPPVLLFHTGLVTRFYIPKSDIRPGLLAPSKTTARCPYVGLASCWTAASGQAEQIRDIAWEYRDTVAGMEKIKGLIAFDRDLVDEICLDGARAVL